VLSKSVQQWDEYTGRITAIDTVELRPRASGYVQRVAYKEGQDVKRGDLMFLIDPSSLPRGPGECSSPTGTRACGAAAGDDP
jgi:multidrug efflux pump subunit AcrA (membrane-fusion protein)